jgi:hypothetical protein
VSFPVLLSLLNGIHNKFTLPTCKHLNTVAVWASRTVYFLISVLFFRTGLFDRPFHSIITFNITRQDFNCSCFTIELQSSSDIFTKLYALKSSLRFSVVHYFCLS